MRRAASGWESTWRRLVLPPEAGGLGIAPSEVARLTMAQAAILADEEAGDTHDRIDVSEARLRFGGAGKETLASKLNRELAMAQRQKNAEALKRQLGESGVRVEVPAPTPSPPRKHGSR